MTKKIENKKAGQIEITTKHKMKDTIFHPSPPFIIFI